MYNRSPRTRSPYSRAPRPPGTTQPALEAMGLLLQASEQQELGLLRQSAADLIRRQLLELVKKCDYQSKCKIVIKLLGLYQQRGWKPEGAIYSHVEMVVKYIAELATHDAARLAELVLIDRIDDILIISVKSYGRKNELMSAISVTVRKIWELKTRLGRMMPRLEYERLLGNLAYWRMGRHSKKQGIHDRHERAAQRSQNDSRESQCSMASESSEQYQQRLKKFEENKDKDDQFKSNLQMMGQNKKRRRLFPSNSFRSNNGSLPKRVSTVWGKVEQPVSVSKQPAKKASDTASVLSKFTFAPPAQSYYTGRSENPIIVSKKIKNQLVRVQSEPKPFQPFYFYVIIKGVIRIIQVSNPRIANSNKLQVQLSGFFNYLLIFHKFHASFSEGIETERLRKFVLSNIQLRQRKIWSIITSRLKIVSEANEKQCKNIVSQLLPEQEQYKFYGFVKKMNAYFFTEYKSEGLKSREGMLTIYDPFFEDVMETIPIKKWTRNYEDHEQYSKEVENQQQFHDFEENTISTAECNIKLKQCRERKRSSQRMMPKFRRAQPIQANSNTCFVVTKKQGRFSIIAQKYENNEITMSNVRFEQKFRNLKVLRKYESSLNSRVLEKVRHEYFKVVNQPKTNFNILTVINRRMGKPSYANARCQLSFVKKVKELGFLVCRFITFRPEQTESLLTEAYVPQTQKYYTFPLKPAIINSCLNLESPTIPDQIVFDCLSFLSKLIKIRKKSEFSLTDSGQFGLLLEIGDITIEGQELLYRVCEVDADRHPMYIESVMLQNRKLGQLASTNYMAEIEFKREVIKISRQLRNQMVESAKLPKFKKYARYNEYISMVRHELQRYFRPSAQLFGKSDSFYYCKYNRAHRTIRRVQFTGDKLSLSTYSFAEHTVYRQSISNGSIEPGNLLGLFKGKAKLRYINRLLNDRLLSHVPVKIQH